MTVNFSSPNPLHRASAAELVRGLQRREITAEAVARSCLERIEQREPEIRAWTCLAPDAALARARELDRGPLRGLLHGLPIGVKDIFDTADLPTAYGSPIYDGFRPAWDAAVVALVRDAGAIVLGKTVTTEFATSSPGKTRNPRNPAHTPGGSSSGSAAAVADCMVPLAFATQTAGSVIRPAAFCGIVGYKPSAGKVVKAGVKNLSETLDTVGALARSVEDAALFVAAMTGNRRLLDGLSDMPANAPAHGAPWAGSASYASIPAPRVGMCRTLQWDQAGTDTQAAMATAAAALSRAGAEVTDIALPADFAPLFKAQTEIQLFDQARNLSYERLHHPARLTAELMKVLELGMAVTPEMHELNLALVADAKSRVAACFGDCDVLFAPSAIGEAPAGLHHTGDPVFCRVWTLLGLPCVHLPFAAGANGLPVGLQVVGRPGADRETLRAACWMHPRLLEAH